MTGYPALYDVTAIAADGFLPEASISITDIHYEYDEPLIFTGNFGSTECLFLKVRQTDGISYFLVSEISPNTIKEMKEGRLSVYGALCEGRLWLISKSGMISFTSIGDFLGNWFRLAGFPSAGKVYIPGLVLFQIV